MDDKQDPHFVLDLINLAFQMTGKPLPCNLQRKLDRYSLMDESNVTLNVRKAAMIFINDSLISDENRVDVASKLYESKMKQLFKKSPGEFLKFLSYFAYASATEYSNHKPDSPEIFLTSTVRFLEDMRKKGRCDVDYWKRVEQAAIIIVENDRGKYKYLPLRETSADLDMSSEKSFVLKIMKYVFDYYMRDLPTYLEMELDEYRMISPNDPNIKNALFVILHELGKKVGLLDSIEPIFLFYYNLSSRHFHEKYYLEFCVYCTKKALIEYSNESKEQSPFKAYDLLVYILLLAKEDGKFSSLESMNDAASQIQEEDRDRIEHERSRRVVDWGDSSESAQQSNDSESLVVASQNTAKGDCTCCTLN